MWSGKQIEAYPERLLSISKETIVYIDGSGIDAYFYRTKCCCRCGENVYIGVSGQRYARINIVAGLLNGHIISLMKYGGTTNHMVFGGSISNQLLSKNFPFLK